MLPKTYDYESAEARLYKFWEEQGFFKPSNDPNLPGHDPAKKPYVISIPPPNVRRYQPGGNRPGKISERNLELEGGTQRVDR